VRLVNGSIYAIMASDLGVNPKKHGALFLGYIGPAQRPLDTLNAYPGRVNYIVWHFIILLEK
jgi:hypothetical protein